eukprot:superscaffoldBa00002314_g13881
MEATAAGGGPPPEDLTPAEELALNSKQGCPLIEGIEGGTSSDVIPQGARSPYVGYKGDGASASRALDEDTISADTEMLEMSVDQPFDNQADPSLILPTYRTSPPTYLQCMLLLQTLGQFDLKWTLGLIDLVW